VFLVKLCRFPASGLVYDYFVDFKKRTFAPWEEKLGGVYKIPAGAPFFKIQVPTVDTVLSHQFISFVQF
jgi:dynein heavy chain